jgi:dTMP kinase
MSNYEGLLITFEGLDFSGKSTQIQLLSSKLSAMGFRVISSRDPGSTDIGEKARKMLADRKNSAMTVMSELNLFNVSRSQLVKEILTPALSNGMIALCDRFYDSTTAYQGFGRGFDRDYILKTNKLVTEGLVPNLTLFLDISIDEMMKRSKGKYDRIESSGREFFERAREGYLFIAKEEPERFKIINGMGSLDLVHEDVMLYVKDLLKKNY